MIISLLYVSSISCYCPVRNIADRMDINVLNILYEALHSCRTQRIGGGQSTYVQNSPALENI